MFAYSYGFKGLLSHFVFIIGTRYFELTSQALKYYLLYCESFI